MKKLPKIILICLLTVVSLLAVSIAQYTIQAQMGGDYTLTRSSLDGGGGISNGGGYSVNGTVGQVDSSSEGALTGGDYTVTGGFWGRPVNRPPVAVTEMYTVTWHSSLTVSNTIEGLLTNDIDAEGDALTAVLATDVTLGELQLQSNGTFTYTPPITPVTTATFTYQAFDGDLLSAEVAVTFNIICPDAAMGELLHACGYAPEEDVRIVWNNNPDENVGYTLWMSTTRNFTTTNGVFITTTTDLQDRMELLHTGVAGDFVIYYYYIEALDCPSCPTTVSNQLGKFDFLIEPRP